jgi:hypothetical protein
MSSNVMIAIDGRYRVCTLFSYLFVGPSVCGSYHLTTQSPPVLSVYAHRDWSDMQYIWYLHLHCD